MNTVKLSGRLAAVAGFVGEGACVADIGTDHGFIPIYLAQTCRAKRVIASDIKPGPLGSARRYARKYGVYDKIDFIEAPGLSGVGEDGADTIIIAGMGGETIIKILGDAPWTKRGGVRLILQPQTKIPELCSWLHDNGYAVKDASLAGDGGRIYTVILAAAGISQEDGMTALLSVLKRKNDPLFSRYQSSLTEKERRIRTARAGITAYSQKGDSKMAAVKDILKFLECTAPAAMKMDFDNVGLLVGRSDTAVTKILVSLDITSAVVQEAARIGAQLIVSHHPLFFSLKSVSDADITGRKVLTLAENGISAICMHTNLDAAQGGVNDALAKAARVTADLSPLSEDGRLETGEAYSYGRVGFLKEAIALSDYLEILKNSLAANGLRYYDAGRPVHKIALVGGSGGSEMHHAVRHGCDTFLTADIKYDVFLDAAELGLNLIDAGHFPTENVVTGVLCERLRERFPETHIELSQTHEQTVRFY